MAASTNSIFNKKSGKSVIVAFDHGIGGKVSSPNPKTVADKFISAKPDGVLMSPPLIHLCADSLAKYPDVLPIATVVCIYRSTTFAGPMQVFDFDYAISMGAKAIKNLLILGLTDGVTMLESMKNTAYLANKAHQKGIPFIVEAVAWGPTIPADKQNSPELVSQVCRIALECGADIIKTNYTGDPKTFKQIIADIPIPVIILGGAKGEPKDLFQDVRVAIDAGAMGVAIGRNVFQHENPVLMTNILKDLVHNGISVKEAIDKLK